VLADMMKHLSIRARSLGIALCFAASVGSLSIAPAMAQDNNPDPGVRCAARVGPGQYEFFLPGEKAVDKDGNRWVCGPDGQWFRDYSSVIRSPITLAASSVITTQTATFAP
jgi:hypothetical protein